VSISLYARKYADALDALERARSWTKTMEGQSVQPVVTWHDGYAVPGYKDVADAVAEELAAGIDGMIARAVHRLHVRAQSASRELRSAETMGDKEMLRAGDMTLKEVEEQEVLVGRWLQLRGNSAGRVLGAGAGTVEVRVSDGGVAWHWRALSSRELATLVALANAARDEKGELI
jgi:hypothetical protein